MREQSLKMCGVCGRGSERRAKQDAKFVSIKCGSLLGAESCSSVLFVRCEGNGKGDCPQSPTSILFATCVCTWCVCVCVDNIVITKRVCAVNNSIKHVSRRTFELRWAQAKIFETGQSNWHFIFPSCPVPSLGHPSCCQLKGELLRYPPYHPLSPWMPLSASFNIACRRVLNQSARTRHKPNKQLRNYI